MVSRKVSLRAIASLCDEIGPEDGVDPRHIRRERLGSGKQRKEQKAKQVCKEAEVTVQLALSALLDEALQELRVNRVEPAPDSRRLLVVLEARSNSTHMTEHEAGEALRKVERRLRMDLASALHRKRVPSLTFAFVGLGEGRANDD